jgi:hypothetical protein
VTFSLLGAEKHNGSSTAQTLKGGNLVTWIDSVEVTVPKDSTVGDVFKKVLDENHYTYVGLSGNYIKSITTPLGLTLAQFTNGNLSGWMYTLNGHHPGLGLNDQAVSNGDVIVWHYTDDYTKEEGSEKWNDPASTGNTGDTSVTPPATVSGGNASASVTLDDMKTAIGNAKGNGEPIVIVPETTGSVNSMKVELGKDALSTVAQQTSSDLIVQTPVGTVTLSHDAISSIASQASGSTVTVSLETVDKTALSADQQKAVGDDAVYDISILSGGKNISSFNGESITISLPFTLKDGQDPKNVTVWYLNDEGKLEKMNCAYDKTTGLATFNTTHLSKYLVSYTEAEVWKNPFTDVKTGDWFYSAVEFAGKNNLFNGTTTTTFEPNPPMSRALFATGLYRLEGSPAVTGTNNFADVKSGEWYTDAVLWANANGIVGGYGNGMFGTTDNVTREQMAVILYNYAKYKGYDVTKTIDLKAYTDAGSISGYAQAAMIWANAEGLLTGRTTTTLVPDGSSSRAEVATILMRFIENIVE